MIYDTKIKRQKKKILNIQEKMKKNCQIINIIIRETMKRGQVNAYEVKKNGKKMEKRECR